MKILLVGGTFVDDNNSDGYKSSIIYKIEDSFNFRGYEDVRVVNGGNINTLKSIIQHIGFIKYDVILWFANVDNNAEKIRDIKKICPKCMLVTSKRNNGEYSKQEIIKRALGAKANLLLEFDTRDRPFRMRLSDPLGNEFYNGESIKMACAVMLDRLQTLMNITRQGTIQNRYFNVESKVEPKFLNYIKEVAEEFHSLINPDNTTRFLGNASKRFRCERGFPSQRIDEDIVLVSRRNIDKRFITEEEFVPVYMDKGHIFYSGENKPSVDTPIQVRLYKELPNVNYMIHSHVYVEDAPYTNKILPCGAIEEVEEILSLIDDKMDTNFCINLKGHGCTIFAKDVDYFEKVKYISRF